MKNEFEIPEIEYTREDLPRQLIINYLKKHKILVASQVMGITNLSMTQVRTMLNNM